MSEFVQDVGVDEWQITSTVAPRIGMFNELHFVQKPTHRGTSKTPYAMTLCYDARFFHLVKIAPQNVLWQSPAFVDLTCALCSGGHMFPSHRLMRRRAASRLKGLYYAEFSLPVLFLYSNICLWSVSELSRNDKNPSATCFACSTLHKKCLLKHAALEVTPKRTLVPLPGDHAPIQMLVPPSSTKHVDGLARHQF